MQWGTLDHEKTDKLPSKGITESIFYKICFFILLILLAYSSKLFAKSTTQLVSETSSNEDFYPKQLARSPKKTMEKTATVISDAPETFGKTHVQFTDESDLDFVDLDQK